MNEQTLNAKFVEEVKKRPLLYNYNLPEYTKKDLTEKAWSEVGLVANLSGSECKERWKNLRAVFVRRLKSAQNESGSKKRKPYYLHSAMQFTLPFIRATSGLSPRTPKNDQDQDESDLFEDEENDQQEESSQPEQPPEDWESEYRTKKKLARNKKRAYNEVDNCFMEYFKAKKATLGTSVNERNQAKKMFLLSLLPELNEMTDQQMNLFKRKVLQLIDDVMTPTAHSSPAPAPHEESVEDASPAAFSYFEAVKQSIEDPPEFKVFDNPENDHAAMTSD